MNYSLRSIAFFAPLALAFASGCATESDTDPSGTSEANYTARKRTSDVQCTASLDAPSRIRAYVEGNKLGFSWAKLLDVPLASRSKLAVNINLSTIVFFGGPNGTESSRRSEVSAFANAEIDHVALQAEVDAASLPEFEKTARRDIKRGSKGNVPVNVGTAQSYTLSRSASGEVTAILGDSQQKEVARIVMKRTASGFSGTGTLPVSVLDRAVVQAVITCSAGPNIGL